MPQLYYDLLFCAAFVIILLILMRFRKTAFAKDGAAYRRIMIGLFFLLGFSLVQLTGNQGLFTGMAYLGDTAGRKVVEATGIVGGLIFLLSGIGAWLPSLAKGRENRRSLNKRYFCLKMINEALDREKDLDKTYEAVMTYLSSYLGFDRCAAYKYSSRRDLLCLSSAQGFNQEHPHALRQISITDTKLKRTLNRFRSTIAVNTLPEWDDSQSPDLVVPIAIHNRLYGAYFCWVGPNIHIDDDLLDFTSVVGAVIGKHTHNHVAKVRSQYHHTQQKAYEELSEVCNEVPAVRDLVPRLFQIVKDLVGAEYLSVASLDNSGENMVRYTIGSGGRLLLEKGVSRHTHGTDIYTVFESRQAIIGSEIRPDDKSGEVDGLFLSCGMRSKMTCPVKAGKRVVAVMTLGHSRPRNYNRYHLHRIEGLTDIIAGVIQREQLNRNLEVKEDHMLRLQLMQGQMLDNPPAQAFFNDACDMLTRRMKCTVARISLLDKDKNNLISQACRSIRETGHELGEEESIPLSLLPWHRMTLDAKKLMLINQEDPESQMPPQESTSALIPNIKSAMLVPIMLKDHVRGIISIGEARNWNRRAFGASDLIFAKDLAAKCSLTLRMKKMQIDVNRNRDDLNRMLVSGSDIWPEMRNQLKSPLTSIIGSVELLKLKGAGDEFSNRYYDLILKSADRIKTMTDDDFVYTDGIEEIEPERVIG